MAHGHRAGFRATVTNGEHTEVRTSNEPVGERNIETELRERVEQLIEQAQSQEQSNTRDADTQETDREHSGEQPAQLENNPAQLEPTHDRDPDIEQAIQEERDRQAAWEPEAVQPLAEQSAETPGPAIEPEPERERIPVERDQDRDPDIQQAIDAERERQYNWEHGIEPDNDLDRGFGIE